MDIKLITSTPNSKQVAFTAIRTCYSGSAFEKIWNVEYKDYVDKKNDEIRLIKHIVGHGHLSTMEHISYTFSIEGISRVLLAQLTRHRVGFSYSVQSQRYVNYLKKDSTLGYYLPPVDAPGEDFQFIKAYNKAIDTYNEMVRSGVKPENARMVLPNGLHTKLIFTCNLRAFIDLYSKRKKGTHAQDEIQDLVEHLRNEIIKKDDWTKHILGGE